jgi:hypothetical protein
MRLIRIIYWLVIIAAAVFPFSAKPIAVRAAKELGAVDNLWRRRLLAYNPGPDNKDYWLAGWEAQRDLSQRVTLGAEMFHVTASSTGDSGRTGFNVGTIINFDEVHHLLCSMGRDISGQNLFSMYMAFQWTFGPVDRVSTPFSFK